jgi:hypothetical protein
LSKVPYDSSENRTISSFLPPYLKTLFCLNVALPRLKAADCSLERRREKKKNEASDEDKVDF